MAKLQVKAPEIVGNIEKIDSFLKKHNIQWTLVSKVLSGNMDALRAIIESDIIKSLHSVADSRLSNLKNIKKIAPEITTMYVKPPHVGWAESVVSCADISLNTSRTTIDALNEEAQKQGKIHKIIIMIELGELREGILRENVVEFYSKVFNLSNIEVIGMGTNLGCMYGVEPTYDKLIQLSLYHDLIEAKFEKKLELVSGGSSITLPLICMKKVPPEINHFRIGEAVFFGTTPYDGKKFDGLSTDTFTFCGNIVELEKKETVPDGNIGDGNVGDIAEFDVTEYKKTYRAVLDFGKIDVDYKGLMPQNDSVNFVGTTSDMTVYELGAKKGKYYVGENIKFTPSYMAVARLMTSKFITKEVLF